MIHCSLFRYAEDGATIDDMGSNDWHDISMYYTKPRDTPSIIRFDEIHEQ